jgi:hypothetical protein
VRLRTLAASVSLNLTKFAYRSLTRVGLGTALLKFHLAALLVSSRCYLNGGAGWEEWGAMYLGRVAPKDAWGCRCLVMIQTIGITV